MSDYKEYRQIENLDKSIANKDYIGLREFLCLPIKVDPTFRTHAFRDGIEYVIEKKGFPKDMLYEPFDANEGELYGDRVKNQDVSLCKQDFSKAVFNLGYNFCEERIADVEKLGKFLYKDAAKNKVATVKTTNDTSPKQTPKRPTKPTVKKVPLLSVIIGVGILIATVVILIQVVQAQ